MHYFIALNTLYHNKKKSIFVFMPENLAWNEAITSKVVVYEPAERAEKIYLFLLYPFLLCGIDQSLTNRKYRFNKMLWARRAPPSLISYFICRYTTSSLIFCTKPYVDVNKSLYLEWPCLIEVVGLILLQRDIYFFGDQEDDEHMKI